MVVDIELSDRWLRISVTLALPTGLFRFGPNAVQGTVAISAGALSLVTYIHKKNGGDFPLALELGVFGTDLSGTPDFSNVGGIGIGIPVIKVNTSVQPSFNIHAWAEYAPTRALSDKFPFAFLSGKYYFYTQNHKKQRPNQIKSAYLTLRNIPLKKNSQIIKKIFMTSLPIRILGRDSSLCQYEA